MYENKWCVTDSSYFLRVHELKKKFRRLSLKSQEKQTVVRQLSSCVHEKFNGFNIASVEHGRIKEERRS